jgi:hypothetical protein
VTSASQNLRPRTLAFFQRSSGVIVNEPKMKGATRLYRNETKKKRKSRIQLKKDLNKIKRKVFFLGKKIML